MLTLNDVTCKVIVVGWMTNEIAYKIANKISTGSPAMNDNPYLAPGATAPEGVTGATYAPRLFSWKGRIGRLRYLAYQSFIFLLTMLAMGVVAAVGFATMGVTAATGKNPPELDGLSLMPILVGLLYIPMLAMSFTLARRRLNDVNRSGWLGLLLLVPLVNLAMSLYLMFAEGTRGDNDYGLPPGPDSMLIKVAGVLMPVCVLIATLASVAIPAFQEAQRHSRSSPSEKL